MDDARLDPCCREAWQQLQLAWSQHGNSARFWDTYQQLLQQLCDHKDDGSECANNLALMAERLGAVNHAMLV